MEHRVFLGNSKLRSLLLRYCGHKPAGMALDKGEAKTMRTLASEVKGLDAVFRWIDTDLKRQYLGSYTACPDPLCRLLTAISQPSPISGFILHPNVTGPLLIQISQDSGLLARRDVRTLSTLQNNCPCLFDILSGPLCQNEEGKRFLTFPVNLLPLLGELGQKCLDIVQSNLRFCWVRAASSAVLMFFTRVSVDPAELPAEEQRGAAPVRPLPKSDGLYYTCS